MSKVIQYTRSHSIGRATCDDGELKAAYLVPLVTRDKEKMQKTKTIEFWDEKHERDGAKEWILTPSDALIEKMLHGVHLLETSDGNRNVLEIGCGTSCLARDLYIYFKGAVSVVATDVSAVCINTNKRRDHAIVKSSKGRLDYQILNILQPNDNMKSNFDVIVDKGCLDTFLFRSGHQEREHLVCTVLNNIHKCLKDGGKYIVITPRQKVKFLRDYRGFSSIKRLALDESSSNVVLADLENCRKSKQCFVFRCSTDSSFVPGRGNVFRDSYDTSFKSDDDACSCCKVTFKEFRCGEDMSGRGSKFWARRWSGHREHCKGMDT
jgi:SAM-dependent methyltransferase